MLIVDGHVVDPATGLHEIADVLIEQDCIKKIYVRSRGEQADYNEAQENGHLVIDAKGKYVMPGFIDLHVHFRDPGLTYKEDIITGSRCQTQNRLSITWKYCRIFCNVRSMHMCM